MKTSFSATSVAELEAAGVDVALAAAFSSSLRGGNNDSASNVDAFHLRAQEAAFSQVDSAILEQSEWTVGGLPAVNFYAVKAALHTPLSLILPVHHPLSTHIARCAPHVCGLSVGPFHPRPCCSHSVHSQATARATGRDEEDGTTAGHCSLHSSGTTDTHSSPIQLKQVEQSGLSTTPITQRAPHCTYNCNSIQQ